MTIQLDFGTTKAAPVSIDTGDLDVGSRFERMLAATMVRPGEYASSSDTEALLAMCREVVFTCTNIVSRAVSQVPLRLYVVRKKNDGREALWKTERVPESRMKWLESKEGLQPWLSRGDVVEEVAHDHLFYSLWDSGNPFMARSQFVATAQKHVDLIGEAFVYIESDTTGLPEKLHLIVPNGMSILTDERMRTIRGYRHEWYDSEGHPYVDTYDPKDILRPYTPNPALPVRAMSPLEAMGLEAEMYHGMNVFDLAMLRNGGVPSTVLVFPEGISESERQRTERRFRRKHAGPHNAGRVATVTGAFDLKQLSLDQRDMEFIQGRKVARDQIANGFGVPISVLTESSTYSNAQVGLFLLAEHGIKPRLITLQDAINRTLVPKYGDPALFAAFDDPTPENKEHKATVAGLMLRTDKTVRKGELRAMLDLNADPELDDELVERPRLAATSRPVKPDGKARRAENNGRLTPTFVER